MSKLILVGAGPTARGAGWGQTVGAGENWYSWDAPDDESVELIFDHTASAYWNDQSLAINLPAGEWFGTIYEVLEKNSTCQLKRMNIAQPPMFANTSDSLAVGIYYARRLFQVDDALIKAGLGIDSWSIQEGVYDHDNEQHIGYASFSQGWNCSGYDRLRIRHLIYKGTP